MPTTSFSVGDIATLNSDIQSIDVSGSNAASNTNYTITLTANITLDNCNVITDLLAINLMSGSTLTIDGRNFALDGGNAKGVVQTRGLFVYAGTVDITNLTRPADGQLNGITPVHSKGCTAKGRQRLAETGVAA